MLFDILFNYNQLKKPWIKKSEKFK